MYPFIFTQRERSTFSRVSSFSTTNILLLNVMNLFPNFSHLFNCIFDLPVGESFRNESISIAFKLNLLFFLLLKYHIWGKPTV